MTVPVIKNSYYHLIKSLGENSVTIEEVADFFKVKKAMAYIHTRKEGFPEPIAEIGRRKFWDKNEVLNWRNNDGK